MALAHWLGKEAGISWYLYLSMAAGVISVLGHNYPLWLNFKGGKGGATVIGVILYFIPWAWPISFGYISDTSGHNPRAHHQLRPGYDKLPLYILAHLSQWALCHLFSCFDAGAVYQLYTAPVRDAAEGRQLEKRLCQKERQGQVMNSKVPVSIPMGNMSSGRQRFDPPQIPRLQRRAWCRK